MVWDLFFWFVYIEYTQWKRNSIIKILVSFGMVNLMFSVLLSIGERNKAMTLKSRRPHFKTWWKQHRYFSNRKSEIWKNCRMRYFLLTLRLNVFEDFVNLRSLIWDLLKEKLLELCIKPTSSPPPPKQHFNIRGFYFCVHSLIFPM